MTSQLSIGELLRDIAIARVEASNLPWCDKAFGIIAAMPLGVEFTTDDLWLNLEHPPEPRAMGAVIGRARKRMIIAATGAYVKSGRAECHARPIAIWRRT